VAVAYHHLYQQEPASGGEVGKGRRESSHSHHTWATREGVDRGFTPAAGYLAIVPHGIVNEPPKINSESFRGRGWECRAANFLKGPRERPSPMKRIKKVEGRRPSGKGSELEEDYRGVTGSLSHPPTGSVKLEKVPVGPPSTKKGTSAGKEGSERCTGKITA